MKKALFILAALAASYACTSNGYTIKGNVEGLSGKVYLIVDNQVVDSTEVQNGDIELKGTVETPVLAHLFNGQYPFGIMILENASYKISGGMTNPNGVRLEGGKLNDKFYAYTDARDELIEEYQKDETTEARRQEILQQDSLTNVQMIEENRDNIFGVLVLTMQGYEPEQFYEEMAKFSGAMQQSSLMQRAKQEMDALLHTQIGASYQDIKLPTPAGEELALSTVVGEGKYVLLDFWASWCSPCMGEVPYLKAAYNKYHSKGFEIYGVSLDDNKEDWTEAIEKYGMNWLHVSSLEGGQSAAAQAYGVQSIPMNLLLDPAGAIVAKNLRGEQLEERLAEIFGTTQK